MWHLHISALDVIVILLTNLPLLHEKCLNRVSSDAGLHHFMALIYKYVDVCLVAEASAQLYSNSLDSLALLCKQTTNNNLMSD